MASPESLNVFVVEGYYGGSHQSWVDGIVTHSAHRITALTHAPAHWRWRLQGGAVTLAEAIVKAAGEVGEPDVLVVSATVDVAALVGLLRRRIPPVPIVTWFHENQLTFPPTRHQRADPWPAWINWRSTLAADRVVFNSEYHRRSFLDALPRLLGRAPDHLHDDVYLDVVSRSEVLAVGVDTARLIKAERTERDTPLIVWNHRWDADKDPESFVRSLIRLAEDDVPFEVALLGEDRHFVGDARAEALRRLGDRVIAAGWQERDEYEALLLESNLVVSTAEHEFFGVSVVEAIAAGAVPVVPDRLSYPEVLGDTGAEYVYREVRPTARLRYLLSDRQEWASAPSALRESMHRFDWSVVAPAYDDLFERVAAAR